jgi:poly(hydroxyalkanoate) depolymerase family esterase
MWDGADERRMAEATRLTRAGRLAEATALIRQALGTGTAGESVRVTPGDARAPIALPGPVASGQGAAPPEEPPARERPGPRVVMPDLKPPPGITLPGARPRRRASRPSWPGRWLAARYEDRHGARAYRVYVPAAGVGPGSSLVLMLHGCTQDAEDFAIGTRMNAVAEAAGLVVAYPEQDAVANASRCWNWFDPAHGRRDAGEPAILAGIARRAAAEHGVAPGRLFVAGLSAGGAMAAVLASAYPDVFAAVGVHSGLAPGCARDLPSALQAMRQGGAPGPSPREAVPLIVFHGDRDTTVHPRNADALVRQWTAGAGTAPVVAPVGDAATRAIYRDADGRVRAERWTVHGAGHAWSGGDPAGSYARPGGPDASAELARFFREHARG